jgi:hypothetical protein
MAGGRQTLSGFAGAATAKEKELKARRTKMRSFMAPILFRKEKPATWSLAEWPIFCDGCLMSRMARRVILLEV